MSTEGNNKANIRAATVVCIVTAFMNPFAGTAFNLAIPIISAEFQSTATSLNWIVTAYMLCTVCLSVPAGKITDFLGHRRGLILGILIFTAASAVLAMAPSAAWLICCRVVQGVGAAMIFATNLPIMVNAYPSADRGYAIGLTVTANYIGMSSGPVIGGVATGNFGWRAVPVLAAVISGITLLIAFFGLQKGTAQRTREEIPGPSGFLLYIAGMFFTMYGMMGLTRGYIGKISFGVGIVLFIIFGFNEIRASVSVIELRLFRENINFLLSNIAALFGYSSVFAISYLLSIYLQLVVGYGASLAGVVLIIQPVMQAIVSPVSGRLSDRVSPFKLASAGMGICAAALVVFILLSSDGSIMHIIIGLIFVGIGFGIFSSPNQTAIMSCVLPQDYTLASALINTTRLIGQILSMAVTAGIMSHFLGTIPVVEASGDMIVRSMHASFIVFAAFCVIGIFISLNRKK